jgi:hypothetical protein
VHPPSSPARTNFTLITECTPESSGCNSVAETPAAPRPPAFELIYEGAIGQPRQMTSLCNPCSFLSQLSGTVFFSFKEHRNRFQVLPLMHILLKQINYQRLSKINIQTTGTRSRTILITTLHSVLYTHR